VMPKVGKKRFPYSKAGRKAAQTYAKRKGKKVRTSKVKRY